MSGLGADMSRYYCCNPIFGSDKSGWDLVAEELELGWTANSFYNPVRNPDMPDFSVNFDLWIDFDVLHFTNLPNASP
jgi:hypothetical protein